MYFFFLPLLIHFLIPVLIISTTSANFLCVMSTPAHLSCSISDSCIQFSIPAVFDINNTIRPQVCKLF